jgi:hypothetical protein
LTKTLTLKGTCLFITTQLSLDHLDTETMDLVYLRLVRVREPGRMYLVLEAAGGLIAEKSDMATHALIEFDNSSISCGDLEIAAPYIVFVEGVSGFHEVAIQVTDALVAPLLGRSDNVLGEGSVWLLHLARWGARPAQASYFHVLFSAALRIGIFIEPVADLIAGAANGGIPTVVS